MDCDKLDLKLDLKDVVICDCELWERRNNEDKMIPDCLGLCEYDGSEQTGLYSLEYNDGELWFGTLHEINAIVKSMLRKMKIDMH